MPWIPLVLWTTVLVAMVTLAIAVALGRPGLAVVATVIAAPFCVLIGGYPPPILAVGGPLALVANAGVAWSLHRRHRWLAATLLIPFAVVSAVMASVVLGEVSLR